MTGICETCEAPLEYERSENYPGVLERISDRWRLIVSNVLKERVIALQQLIDGEWHTFIAEYADGIIDLPDDFGISDDAPTGDNSRIIGVNTMTGRAKH